MSCTVSVDISIPCTSRFGGYTSAADYPATSVVSCRAGETMVSCGYDGLDQIGGTNIDPTTNVCEAYDHSSSQRIGAVARCCTFPTEANVVTSTVSSIANESVSAQCLSDSVLTGCSMYFVSGNADQVKGAFAGAQSSPPQTAAWISTNNQCNAEGNLLANGTIVQAIARCLSVSHPAFTLTCNTKATFTTKSGFGACPSGSQMMACAGFAANSGLDKHYVSSSYQPSICYGQRDWWEAHYVNAICCQMILTTSHPTTMPTFYPKSSTFIPTVSPTGYPSVNPTSLAPSSTPSEPPSHSLSLPCLPTSHVPSAQSSVIFNDFYFICDYNDHEDHYYTIFMSLLEYAELITQQTRNTMETITGYSTTY
eukprot:292972_1